MWRAAPRFAQRRRQSARAPHILERHIIRGAQCWLLGLPWWRRRAGTPLVAIAAGGMTLAIAQIAFAMTQSLILRAIIAAVFALPATLAGYHLALAMAHLGVPSPVWQQVFACLGAAFIGGTAWTRLSILSEPRPLNSSAAVGSGPQPVLTAAAHQK